MVLKVDSDGESTSSSIISHLQNIFFEKILLFLMKSSQMKGLTVSMTGFSNDPKEEQYKQMLQCLNIRYSPSLVESAFALIVRETTTEKYKIAKVYKKPILCVKIDWLIQSNKLNTILEPERFQIIDIFYGVQAHIVGFDERTSLKIQQTLSKNGGSCHIIDVSQIVPKIKNSFIKLLIVEESYLFRIKPLMSQISFPVVGVEWIIDSINGRICKYPFDYAFNQIELRRNDTFHHYKKMKNKLDSSLNSSHLQYNNMLSETIIYLGTNINPEMAKLFKKLIVVYGGFYLQDMCPSATHILIEPVDQSQYNSYCINGVLTHVLRVQWLVDTIYFNKRMLQSDYVIRSFKTYNSTNTETIDQRSATSSLNSAPVFSLKSSQSNQDSNRKTISMPLSDTKSEFFPKNKRKFDSLIFLDMYFYIQGTQRKDPDLQKLYTQITKNKGKCYNSRKDIENGLCYYVLKDSPQCSSLIKKLKQQLIKTSVKIQPVSTRWIRDCITKGRFIDIVHSESYIYKPFPFVSPIPGFHRFVFYVAMMDSVCRLRLKELYNALGSIKNTLNKTDITHCLCGEGYSSMTVFQQIRSKSTKAVFLDWKWLIDCFNSGKIVDTAKYQICLKPTENTETH